MSNIQPCREAVTSSPVATSNPVPTTPTLAIGETVTVMLLSLSCLLSLYCHAYCHLLSSTAAIVIMVNPYQPFLPAVHFACHFARFFRKNPASHFEGILSRATSSRRHVAATSRLHRCDTPEGRVMRVCLYRQHAMLKKIFMYSNYRTVLEFNLFSKKGPGPTGS